MRKHRTLALLLLFLFITIAEAATGAMFTESGLVDMPTGDVLKHGIFGIGTSLAFDHTSDTSDNGLTAQENPFLGTATAVRLNFGVFDRVEFGLRHRWNEQPSESLPPQTASLKLQLLKEQEVGVVPSLAIGVENLSGAFFSQDSEAGETENPSVFLALSKTFNLPRIHQFSVHIGGGTAQFAFTDQSFGLFAGLSKEFQPAFARGDITMNIEFDGSGVNLGMRYLTPSGLQIALGAETLNNPDDLRYLVAVSWSNEALLEQIDETKRLVKRATQLATEAKRAAQQK